MTALPITLLGPYERRARVIPGLLAILPLGVAVWAVGSPQWQMASSLISLVGVLGGTLVLSLWVRDKGLQAQERLWSKWGRPPINQALLQDTRASEERRAKLERLVGVPVDHNDREQTDRAVKALFRLLDDSDKHPLVFAENCNYGFMRNLYGVRTVGRSSSTVALVALIPMLAIAISGQAPSSMRLATLPLAVGALTNALLLCFWFLFPVERRVLRANELLRDRVMESLDTLSE